VERSATLTLIEKPATEGVKELRKILVP